MIYLSSIPVADDQVPPTDCLLYSPDCYRVGLHDEFGQVTNGILTALTKVAILV